MISRIITFGSKSLALILISDWSTELAVTLRRILSFAITEDKLSTNPIKGVKFFREPQGHLRFLSDAEITRLREVVELCRSGAGHPHHSLSKSGRTRHAILSEAALAILRDLPSEMQSTYVFPSSAMLESRCRADISW